MFCDWYQATINDNHQIVMDVLSQNLGGAWIDQQKGKLGYKNQHCLLDKNKDNLATVLHGSNNFNQQLPHVLATSKNANNVMNVIRDNWKNHVVTRIDVAEDFQGDKNTFLDFVEVSQSIADSMGVTTNTIGDWLGKDNANGRTFYMGSPKSPLVMRIYEKGKEVAIKNKALGLANVEGFENVIRVELQCRPQKDQRLKAASLPLEAFWGFGKWSAIVAKEIFDVDVPRINRFDFQLNSRESALQWMCKQYQNHLVDLCESLGGWDKVGIDLGRMIKQIQREKDKKS